jgi:hypothetical protein
MNSYHSSTRSRCGKEERSVGGDNSTIVVKILELMHAAHMFLGFLAGVPQQLDQAPCPLRGSRSEGLMQLLRSAPRKPRNLGYDNQLYANLNTLVS